MRRHRVLGLVLSLFGVGSFACSEDVLVAMNDPMGVGLATAGGNAGAGGSGAASGNAGSSSGSGNAGASGGAAECVPSKCGSSVFLCGDCEDNDSDGLIDADDTECLGPCDNTEVSLMLGIQGNDPGSCQADCAFDRGASRTDGCQYTHECDERSVAPSYPPTGRSKCAYDENVMLPGSDLTCADMRASQPAECLEVCLPLAPNGCDCFGCCELPGRSNRFVWVGAAGGEVSGCDLTVLDDEAVCPPCTPVPSCFNECEECEYCAGGVEPAPSCGGVVAECDGGRISCTGRTSCPQGHYCITGCCVPEPT
jgi:hypothetical protein